MAIIKVTFAKQNLARSQFQGKTDAIFQVTSNGNGNVLATVADNNFPAILRINIQGDPSYSLGNPDNGGIIECPPNGFRVNVIFASPINLDVHPAFQINFFQEGATVMDHYHT